MPLRSSLPGVALLAWIALLVAAGTGNAQTPDAVRIRANAAEITFVGRVQAQFVTTSVDGEPGTEMFLRRVRFGANLRLNDVVSGRIHPEFAGGAITLGDAYGLISLTPGVQILAGRAQRPFGFMEQLTSLQILPIERGVRIRGVQDLELSSILGGLRYGERDTGVQLRGAPTGAPLRFAYAAGMFAGPLQGASGSETTQQFVARATIEPLPATRFGIAWNRRDFARPSGGGGLPLQAGSAILADVEYGSSLPVQGLYLALQAATGDFEPFSGRGFSGAQIWASYSVPAGERVPLIEPLLRVSYADIDEAAAGAEGGTLVTPGLNVHLGGLNRVQFNFDFWKSADGASENSSKVQFQMAF